MLVLGLPGAEFELGERVQSVRGLFDASASGRAACSCLVFVLCSSSSSKMQVDRLESVGIEGGDFSMGRERERVCMRRSLASRPSMEAVNETRGNRGLRLSVLLSSCSVLRYSVT